MEPQNTNGQDLQFQTEQPKQNKKPIIIVFLVVAIVVLGYVIFIKVFSPKQISGLEVAKKINTFLDQTIKEDGGMDAGTACLGTPIACSPLAVQENQPHLGQAIYSYYLLAEATGEETYRLKADKAMTFVLDKCKTNTNMCAWNFFPLARYYFDTKEDKYLKGMLVPAEEFLNMSDGSIIASNAGHKLGSLYQATEDVRYKNRLIGIADKELLKWAPEPDTYTGNSIQVVWSIFLPAYEITKDKKYLSASEKFFDVFNFPQNLDLFTTIDPMIKGADALLTLGEISDRGAQYKSQVHDALQVVINRFWDTPENQLVNGDYGLIEIPKLGEPVFKKTISNGWLSKSFTRLANDKFDLPIKKQ